MTKKLLTIKIIFLYDAKVKQNIIMKYVKKLRLHVCDPGKDLFKALRGIFESTRPNMSTVMERF